MKYVFKPAVLVAIISIIASTCARNFTIDKVNHVFLKDGQPFRVVSGSLHYFRVPPQYWQDRMEKMKAAGLTVIQTYVEWSRHEPEPGTYNFQGMYDLVAFLQTANQTGLLVTLRAGPYIGAERDMGGLPYWLLRENPKIQIRSTDPSYLAPMDSWMTYLLKLITSLLYKNDGPIIMVQFENEYSVFNYSVNGYMAHLKNVTQSILGEDVVIFTNEYPTLKGFRCGYVPGTMLTLDFGPTYNVQTTENMMRMFDKDSPFMVAEYWPGWLDFWGFPHANISAIAVVNTLNQILRTNASVNFYMFHGGTNFGFTNGAHPEYNSIITSYDYGAPLSEAGDPTPLFFQIRDVLGQYGSVPPGPGPSPAPKLALTQPLNFTYCGSVKSHLSSLGSPVFSQYPKTFEQLSLDSGFMVYATTLSFSPNYPANLTVNVVHDRASVIVNEDPVGILDRQRNITTITLSVLLGDVITIIVENMGRSNVELANDPKGLLSNVTLDGVVLTGWTHTPMPLNNTSVLQSLQVLQPYNNTNALPGFFTVNFTLPNGTQLLDTFLDPSGWSKGVAFLNGVNLGRYWPVMGPQVTLYVPGCWLKPYPEVNSLTVLEQESAPCMVASGPPGSSQCQMKLVDTPNLTGPNPPGVPPKS